MISVYDTSESWRRVDDLNNLAISIRGRRVYDFIFHLFLNAANANKTYKP